MENYNLSIYRKYTVWEREYYSIEAKSETEALEKCLNSDVEAIDREYMHGTIDYMTPEDNGNYPTIEVYNDNTNKRIFSNVPDEDR